MSMHNLIIGTPYIDIGETMTIHKEGSDQKAIIQFITRGWFAKGKEIAQLQGEVCNVTDLKKKKKSAP